MKDVEWDDDPYEDEDPDLVDDEPPTKDAR